MNWAGTITVPGMLLLVAVLIAAIVIELKTGKIINGLTYPAAAAGLGGNEDINVFVIRNPDPLDILGLGKMHVRRWQTDANNFSQYAPFAGGARGSLFLRISNVSKAFRRGQLGWLPSA